MSVTFPKSLHGYFWAWYQYNKYTVDEWWQDLFLRPREVEKVWNALKENHNGKTLALWAEHFGEAGDVHVKIQSQGVWLGASGPGVLIEVPKKSTPVEILSMISEDWGLPGFDSVSDYPPETQRQSNEGYAWFVIPANTTVVVDISRYNSETGSNIVITPEQIDGRWEYIKAKYEPEVWGVVVEWTYNMASLRSLIWCAYGRWKLEHSSNTELTQEEKDEINKLIEYYASQ